MIVDYPLKLKNLIGEPLLRVEDRRLLTGSGCFTDDLEFDGQLHAVFVRSPHAHAHIESVDMSVAAKMPGVRAVANGETLAKSGLQPINPLTRSPDFPISNKDGSELPDVRRWPLARNKVRFVGEAVAVVAAESVIQAQEAAEQIEIEYEPLPAITDVAEALADDASLVWDELGSNLCTDHENGDSAKVEEAFDRAADVITVEVEFPRHTPVYMEPRTVIGRFDKDRDRFEIYCGSQSPHWHQRGIAEMLNVSENEVRVVSLDTGGGFGARTSPYPEFAVVGWLARNTGDPVRWVPDRAECFSTDVQSRDHKMEVSLAVDSVGDMTAIRISSVWRVGAYIQPRSMWLYANYMNLMACGVYRIPAAHYRLQAVFSNTASIGAFRGVARAEVSYAIERAVDEAARRLSVNRLSFRRNNLIKTEDMPWTTATGAVYSSSDFAGNFSKLLAHIDQNEYLQRHESSRGAGKYRGIGFSAFVDSVGGSPNEFAEIQIDGELVCAYLGTKSIGTGHETAFAQVLSSQLQIPVERVQIVDGDTDIVKTGSGTHASRSLRFGGAAMFYATEKVLEKGREYAAEHLEVSEQDVEYAAGRFFVSGTDRRVGLFEIAKKVVARGDLLSGSHEHFSQVGMFASGCHACEVEVDPETGMVTIERYIAVSDPGKLVNPVIAEGQVHGGIVQGIGHAVSERVVYEPDTGQLLTGSFMDYAILRADEVPEFETSWNAVETDENPLGVKGVGEIGTMGAPAAVMNAITDALKPLGITDIQMPVTPEIMWRQIRSANTSIDRRDSPV